MFHDLERLIRASYPEGYRVCVAAAYRGPEGSFAHATIVPTVGNPYPVSVRLDDGWNAPKAWSVRRHKSERWALMATLFRAYGPDLYSDPLGMDIVRLYTANRPADDGEPDPAFTEPF